MFTFAVAFAGGTDELTPSEEAVLGTRFDVYARRLALLESPSVQKRLNLTDEQKASLALLKPIAAEKRETARDFKPTIQVDGSGFTLISEPGDELVSEVLTTEQLKKLGQIQLHGMTDSIVFHVRALARHLKVTDEQKLAYETKHRESGRQIFAQTQGKTGPDLFKAFEQTRPLYVQPLTFLTDEQRNAFEELRGPGPRLAGVRRELSRNKEQFDKPSSPVKSAIFELLEPFSLLFADSLLDHMEVTERQRDELRKIVVADREECRRKVEELRKSGKTPWIDQPDEVRTQRKSATAAMWIKVNKVLSTKQQERLFQAWLQVRGYNELFSTTETSRKLKITNEQQRKLSEFIKAHPNDTSAMIASMGQIVTAEQRKEFEQLKGEPLPQNIIQDCKAARNMAYADEFGIPTFGIGAGK